MIAYCNCETPVMNVEYDAGCRRCGLPVDFSPPAEPCADCGHPVVWIEQIGDYRHVDPEVTCWLHQSPIEEVAATQEP